MSKLNRREMATRKELAKIRKEKGKEAKRERVRQAKDFSILLAGLPAEIWGELSRSQQKEFAERTAEALNRFVDFNKLMATFQ